MSYHMSKRFYRLCSLRREYSNTSYFSYWRLDDQDLNVGYLFRHRLRPSLMWWRPYPIPPSFCPSHICRFQFIWRKIYTSFLELLGRPSPTFRATQHPPIYLSDISLRRQLHEHFCHDPLTPRSWRDSASTRHPGADWEHYAPRCAMERGVE